ncbi:MAG: hypothetical protein IJD22_02925 [Clostridia bacterium]|nr:hypothetical protein [Clostridia bacterium]
MLTPKNAENIIKLLFSAVILQLLFVSLGCEQRLFSPFSVIYILEHSAAAAMCILGGGALFEYILKDQKRS